MKSATLGYPRIGASRELKRAQEQHWAGVISAAALREIGDALEAGNVDAQAAAGVGLVGVGDHTLYDHVLDWTARLGAAPARFGDGPAEVGGDVYFAMARGKEGVAALDMSKFLGTNYHYMVNEIGKGFAVRPDFTEFVGRIAGAVARVGSARVSPIVLGPVTYAALARLSGGVTAEEVVRVLTPAYRRLLEELKAVGVGEVQMHEPALVLGGAEKLREQFKAAYEVLAGAGVPLHVVTYFDDVPAGVLDWVVRLPGVVAVSLDFTRGDNLRSVREVEFPAGVRLGAGVLDARSVWDDEVEGRLLLEEVKGAVGERVEVCVQPSASLQFLPVDLDAEDGLAPEVKGRLAFAKQKVEALVRIAGGAGGGSGGTGGRDAGGVCGGGGEVAGMKIDEAWFSRVPFEERRPRQFSVDGGYGTTTIGSFPQTPEIRRLRSRLKAGKLGKEQYDAEIDKQIAFMIGVQEALGLDVFVHGEPERTDMVEYFGVHLDGFAFTTNGWVQSYGSRCVRPPIIHGDISRSGPMTVREFAVAQGMTSKPVKGMLTGPITIINWSFPRKDVSREVQAYQLGLALREEVIDLEAAGCRIVQVDDPALREGLPLKEEAWADYLRWAVRAFRLCTAGVKPQTQIVSHLCYSDFEDILAAIDDMDVDVLTIENSRSGDQMLRALAAFGYRRDLGAGVYDIHSPVVPTVKEVAARIAQFQATGLRAERLWVNPDCGLKTRKWHEVLPSLQNMQRAAVAARAAESP